MTRTNVALIAFSLFLPWLVKPAHAAVYPGCAAPPTTLTGNAHYVDPVNGSMAGDGTAAHPWHTLTEVVAAGLFYNTPVHGQPHINPSAPIQAGDTVYLMSGNHGPVRIQGWNGVNPNLVGFNNSSFITIAAAPGQTPVLSQLDIVGASKWAFRGLTIQSLNNTGSYPAGGTQGQDYWLIQMRAPHSDLVFDGDNLSSDVWSNVSQWTLSDWLTKRSSGIKDTGGTCIAMTNNSVQYIGFGLATQNSSKVLISGNNIDYFSDDGIDFGSSNLQILSNTITNSVEDGDGFHRDAMQGQPYTMQATVSNVAINYNTIIRINDPNLANPGYLQGIDEFDGGWQGVTVSHNTVVTDAGQGISFYGVSGASITNNILLGDTGRVRLCAGLTFSQCQAKPVAIDTSTVPGVVINHSKAGAPSANVTIQNNYVTAFSVDPHTVSLNLSYNTCVLTGAKCAMGIPINGAEVFVATPGTYGNHNVISKLTAYQTFVDYDPVTPLYNLALKP